MRLSPLFLLAALPVAGCVEPEPTLSEKEDQRIQSVGEQAASDAMVGVDTSDFEALE